MTLHRYLNVTGLMPDYVLISNAFSTECKAGKEPIDPRELEAIILALRSHATTLKTQIFLLGGIDENNVQSLEGYDHDGVSVMSLAHFPERLKVLLKRIIGE